MVTFAWAPVSPTLIYASWRSTALSVSLCEHIIRLIRIAQTAGYSLTPAVGGCYKPPPPTAHLSHTPFLFLAQHVLWLISLFVTRTHTPLLSEPPWYPGDSIHPSSLRWRKATPAPPLSVFSLPQLSLDKSYDRAFKRSTSRNPLRSGGDVWSRLTVFVVFFPPGSEVTTMHNPATWWRRGKRWIKKEREGNKGQFDSSFPFDGLMGARYTNGCLCIPVISCESSACVFPAYRCSLAAHIHWIQPISGRLINEQPPSLLASIRVFSPLCPQPFYRCVL